MANGDRLVVVTYDAGTDSFTVNPNPVTMPYGKHKLYFALQTINKGDSDRAEFISITITNTVTHRSIDAEPLQDGFEDLYLATIDNTNTGKEPQRLDYILGCEYDGSTRKPALDPTIILQPEPMPLPST